MSELDLSRSCKSPGDSGFSLLELLIVLAILGTLVAVIPSAVAGLPAMRLRSAAVSLGETLRQAHDDAIGTGRAVDVIVSRVRRSYAVRGQIPIDLPPLIDTLEAARDGPAALGEEVITGSSPTAAPRAARSRSGTRSGERSSPSSG